LRPLLQKFGNLAHLSRKAIEFKLKFFLNSAFVITRLMAQVPKTVRGKDKNNP